ncbi:hypothetical protein SDC9_209135 [bioreactor metagenome]|uniref:Uncharacterized protein n=1 Tax=bioreactor metagenome TaxID=1076179 RepID=A0A645JCI5_9ZZZZ
MAHLTSYRRAIRMMGTMLAGVMEPPWGSWTSVKTESTDASAIIMALSVNRFVFWFIDKSSLKNTLQNAVLLKKSGFFLANKKPRRCGVIRALFQLPCA